MSSSPRRTPRSFLLLLPPFALTLLLTGCFGQDKDETPKPEPSACTVLRVTPESSVKSGFVDPLMTVVYSAASSGVCDDFKLVDTANAKVTTAVVAAGEWTNPQGGVVGSRTIEPVQPLRSGTTYELQLNGRQVSRFTTGTEHRGRLVDVTDLILQLSPLPESAHVDRSSINDVLSAFTERLTENNRATRYFLEPVLRHQFPRLARPEARYGAHISKLTYRSADAQGNPTTLSGLLVVPEHGAGGAPVVFERMPVVIAHRGAMDSEAKAPSSGANPVAMPGLLAAGKGHVFLGPDLIGTGDTATLPQAYLVAADTAAQTQDMLRAARAHVQKQYAAALGRDLRIFGASQGGYSAIAGLPHLAREATVRLVSAGSGPYDVYRTFNGALRTAAGEARDAYAQHVNLDFLPGRLRMVMGSLQAYGRFAFDPASVFAADGSLLPSFLQSYKNNQQASLVMQLGANSLVGTTQAYVLPEADVRLYHFSTDPLVPAQNTADLLAALRGTQHRFASLQPGNCHEGNTLVKLAVEHIKKPTLRHTICVGYQLDDFVAEL